MAVREVANGALIPVLGGGARSCCSGRGRTPERCAESSRAGLENLARTLSVEWARFAITAAMVAPGAATSDDELAELVCFLVSPAGEYLTGCRLELGATG